MSRLVYRKILLLLQSLHIKILAHFSGKRANEILKELYELKQELIKQEVITDEKNSNTDDSDSAGGLC